MPPEAELIVTNARILTMDETNPRAEAIACAGGRIVALGSPREIEAMAGPGTRVIDARGASVLPGFIESHLHLLLGAGELVHLQLHGVSGFDALRERVLAYAAGRPDDAVLMAQGADYTILGGGEALTRHHLDRILPDRPLALVAPDHHTMWANTRALEAAGLLQGRALNPGNEVVMGADGLATGELREAEATNPINALAGMNRIRAGVESGREPIAPTAAQWAADKQAMKLGLAHAAEHGITSFHNMDGNIYQIALLESIEREGGLSCRARIPFHYKKPMTLADLDKASEMAERWRGDWLSSGMVKIFQDGVIDSGTAHMIEPYADAPGWCGEPYFDDAEFADLAVEIDRRGLQIAVHAIGDQAVRTVLDGYEAARRANGQRDSRHRIEHIEVTTEADIPRFAELGVIASMQPPHPPGSMGLPLEPTVSKIGRARWHLAYASRTIRDTGAHVVFASDWPVSPIDPIAGIQAAMLRKPWADGLPEQHVTLHQAIAGYTVEGAYAEFAETRKGRLRSGYLADMVVLSGDAEATDPEALHEIRPAFTICGGKVTFER